MNLHKLCGGKILCVLTAFTLLARGTPGYTATLALVGHSGKVQPSRIYAILHSFANVAAGDGAWAPSDLLADDRGDIFGTTILGGSNGAGIVFELERPQSGETKWTERILHSFGGVGDGARPNGGLIADETGALYGTTAYGGASGWGTVFRLTQPSHGQGQWNETILHSFSNSGGDGATPLGRLARGFGGALFGATASGGQAGNCSPGGCGTVFELAPPIQSQSIWTETVLHAFTGANGDGSLPLGGLTNDGHGDLIGLTNSGGGSNNLGTVFMLTRPPYGRLAWTEQILYSFTGASGDGANPESGDLVRDHAGSMYGTTSLGGTGYGTVFKLAAGPSGRWLETVIHSFTQTDGATPQAGLITDLFGNLYGTTSSGGNPKCAEGFRTEPGCGTVFKLTPPTRGEASWSETTLHSFGGPVSSGDGEYPQATLTIDRWGELYGATAFGGLQSCTIYAGASGCGVIFKIDSARWAW